jgi:hypothetical protein
MNVATARTAYATIMATLRKERGMRDRVLPEPRRSAAVLEADTAIAALESLGHVIRMAVDAGLLTADAVVPEQAPLLDVPETKYP